MTLQPFRKLRSDNRILNTVQDLIGSAFDALYADKFLFRQRVEVALASGNNIVFHNLKRTPSGWMLSDRNGTATVYRTAWDNQTITLVASGTVNVILEVF